MPLISQSKVFNFQLLCQLTRAQATEAWASASEPVPGDIPGRWALGREPTQHETQPSLAKLPPEKRRRPRKGRGKGRGKRRLREWKWKGKKIRGGKRDGHERACLVLSLCPQLFFLALFKWLRGPSQRCYFPINRASTSVSLIPAAL